ncbi:hypothetical protein DRW03_11790 [Corallococcus sp. H22C18031201]|uniref:hypothetical protein n=1 Tax=Citreicoccus inhibens TaxID=2849499 RepID=UPI000E74E5E4|nr:hypothetical protein [Citreicoccus inhibens]MBU8894301.1 CBM9 family sugar-binding protein [Citreicoccus inhibens]RJS23012.1 hypothetical protein DRW03_11790 [Corallococcus sp. H22C18031201]
MRTVLLPLCLLLLALPASAQDDRTSRPVPTLKKAPRLEAGLKDFVPPLVIKPEPAPGASANFTAKVGWRKDMLFVGVEATDDQLLAGDVLNLTLFFPGAGTTATGYTYRFAFDGKRASGSDSGTPRFAQDLVNAGVQRRGDTLMVMAAIPVRALPRFPARDPLVMELCLTFEDQDQVGSKAVPVSNCKGGTTMVGDALRLPDELRKNLKLKPPEAVTALESAAGGWLGWDLLSYPAWVQADEPLTPSTLKPLVAPGAVDPAKADLNVPETLSLPDGRPIILVVSGKNPYAVAGQCDSDDELRVALYVVTGKTALRALEWPVATCALGRASSVVLEDEGALTIGYSNGATMNFAWSGDHFERTELGKR